MSTHDLDMTITLQPGGTRVICVSVNTWSRHDLMLRLFWPNPGMVSECHASVCVHWSIQYLLATVPRKYVSFTQNGLFPFLCLWASILKSFPQNTPQAVFTATVWELTNIDSKLRVTNKAPFAEIVAVAVDDQVLNAAYERLVCVDSVCNGRHFWVTTNVQILPQCNPSVCPLQMDNENADLVATGER